MKVNTTSIIGIQLFTVMLFGLLLASTTVSADDSVVDDVNITVPVSCSMSGTGMDSHNANISNGTYQPNIGTTTLHAFCNDNEGFAIYAAGYTGDEIGATNSNKLVGTSASSNSTIDTGLATTAGTPDVSNWAMKLAITQDSGDTTGTNAFTIDSDTEGPFSTYHTVPNTYTKVAHKTATTNMTTSTGGVKLTTTYAAYISKNQSADTYSGQVIYTLVHPASHAAPVVCVPNGTTISTIVCMQDISSANKASILASMNEDQQYTLIDKRDEKTYMVAKLKDGKVWMTQNLDLDIDENTTYTNEDTDLGWNGTSYGESSWTPIRSTYGTVANNLHEWCVGGTRNAQYGYCTQNNTPESYNPGSLYWNGMTSDWSDWNTYYNSCDYSAGTPVCDTSLNPLSTYTTISGTPIVQYHLGNFYNWTAAIATNDSSSMTSGSINQSICPAGWTLPYTNQNGSNPAEGDFVNLWSEYGWNSGLTNLSVLWSNPIYFAPVGYYDGNLAGVGSDAGFWSAVTNGAGYARAAYFTAGGGAYPADPNFRYLGYSIRCILR